MSGSIAQSLNPYEAPKSAGLLSATLAQISYDGKALKIPKDFTFPPICIKTGETTDLGPQQTRKLSWFPPLVAVLIIFGLIPFLLVALLVSKKGEIRFQVSNEVARKRRKAVLRNWGLFLLSIVLFGLAIAQSSPILAWGGTLFFLAALVFGMATSRYINVKSIDKTHIWLLGIPQHVAEKLITYQGQIGTNYSR